MKLVEYGLMIALLVSVAVIALSYVTSSRAEQAAARANGQPMSVGCEASALNRQLLASPAL